MTLRKAFDGEVYYWYEDGKSRQAKSRVAHTPNAMTNESDKVPERAFLKACHPDSPNHYCTWTWCGSKPVQGSVEYIRADLLATARKEAREAAFKETMKIIDDAGAEWGDQARARRSKTYSAIRHRRA